MDSSSPASRASLSGIHSDIIQTHILPNLDGPSLTAIGSASSELRSLCNENQLWKHICLSTWPSLEDPRISQVISTFPSGHRSFYTDSYPILHPTTAAAAAHGNRLASELISAIDIRYQDKIVYSKVETTDTAADSFLTPTMWIEHFEPNPTGRPGFSVVNFDEREEEFFAHLEESVTLNWILIDPTRKRAGNFSSVRPISVRRHWTTNEVTMEFVTILAGRWPGEFVQCMIEVTCGGKEGGELHVRELIMQLQDLDSRCLTGKECLVVFQGAMDGGRKKLGSRGEEKENYAMFLKLKGKRREAKERLERRQTMVNRVIKLSMFVVILLSVFDLLFFRHETTAVKF